MLGEEQGASGSGVSECTAPWDLGRRQQRPERGLSHQQVRVHIPGRNSELITCRRHRGQMGGSSREGVKPAVQAAAKFSLVPKAGLN